MAHAVHTGEPQRGDQHRPDQADGEQGLHALCRVQGRRADHDGGDHRQGGQCIEPGHGHAPRGTLHPGLGLCECPRHWGSPFPTRASRIAALSSSMVDSTKAFSSWSDLTPLFLPDSDSFNLSCESFPADTVRVHSNDIGHEHRQHGTESVSGLRPMRRAAIGRRRPARRPIRLTTPSQHGTVLTPR